MLDISKLISISESAGAAVQIQEPAIECPEEYKNLSMSESSLYFENQILKCELEYRDIMDESVNTMIQDMLDRQNGIVNEAASGFKDKIKKIKDFIVKFFTTIFNAIKNFIVKVGEKLKIINKTLDVSVLDNASIMKPKTFILDDDDKTYSFNIKLRPFNITDPNCSNEISDEINTTFDKLYDIIEKVVLDKQTLDRDNVKEVINSIKDILLDYNDDVVDIFDKCTKDGQYKNHSKYGSASKSGEVKPRFDVSEDSVEITFKLSDYMKVDDSKSDDFFIDLIKKATGVDYHDILPGINKYLKDMETLSKKLLVNKEKLEQLVDKIDFTDNDKDAGILDAKANLMFEVTRATHKLYSYTTGLCISNIYVILANKAAFTKAFIAAKHDYIMWSGNNKGKKKRYTNKNEEEDAKSRKKNNDDFDVEED